MKPFMNIHLNGGRWKEVRQSKRDIFAENQELHYHLTRYQDYGGMVI